MNPFIRFTASRNGRIVRIVVGAILVLWGSLGLGGTDGLILAIVGMVPLLAGLLDNRRTLCALVIVYLGTGLAFSLGTLVCYNVRNWELMGGFSFPPLYLLGLPLHLFAWPVFLRANLINGLGLFGRCVPL